MNKYNKLIAIGIVSAFALSAASQNAVLYRFSGPHTLIQEDVMVEGRILATGELGPTDGLNAAIIASPSVDSLTIGVIATSSTYGILTNSDEGYGINAITMNGAAVRGFAFGGNGVGVEAVSIGSGPALKVDGAIRKANEEDQFLTVYDVDTNEVVARFRYSFE